MKDGFRIIDTDTHVGPNVETLELYAGPVLKQRWSELEPYYQKVTEGHHLSISPIPFKRPLNTSAYDEEAQRGGKIPLRGKTTANYKEPPTPEVQNLNAEGRLKDMDREGTDVHVILPATFATAASALDTELALEIYSAYNRYLQDFCAKDPARLKGSVLVTGADPEWSAREIKQYESEPWAAAVKVVLPEGLISDDPALEPIWRVMNDADLPMIHHSFFYEPPYFPGYRDIGGNLMIARSAAHPWGAQRIVAYMLLSGLFDRFPNLRIGFAECSAGWIGGWLNRLEYQAAYLRHTLPELEQTPIEYAQSGRIFCGIELGEGEAMARSIMEVVGDGVLMFSSDYPHPQCEFPESPDVMLAWKGLGDDVLRKIMSENAERYLRM